MNTSASVKNGVLRTEDERFMAEALELARRGIALASPNPCVGAVVVRDGQVVGRGYYTYDGLKHAEVLALEQAAERARGATLYLNLEPCSHQGRTGPCADAVIAAGVRRVVASIPDPNPQVSGVGLQMLRAAGIEVMVSVAEAEARKLNEAFARHVRTGMPLVVLKTAMTLDGKIAPPPGDSGTPSALGVGGAASGWITSEIARAHVQELRHAADAILVGVGTIIADDPLLTDRTGLPRRRPLLRVVLDSRLRLPLESRVVKTAREDLLVLCSFAEEKKRKALEEHGVKVEQLPLGSDVGDGRPDVRKIPERLGTAGITSVIIEGGALVNWAALAAGIVDKVFLYYAPKILAGTGSVPFVAGAGFRRISEAVQVNDLKLHRYGEDFAVEGYVRDPYADSAGPDSKG
jgi:diaminohydroxyphosphoribosylaminopyrimidine deaminase/5-amino-6-(5-phosphoribosylamino)uracil reductase